MSNASEINSGSTSFHQPEDPELVRSRAEQCQSLADAFARGVFSGTELVDKLKETGASFQEIESYVNQAKEQQAAQCLPRPSASSSNTGTLPSDSHEDDSPQERANREKDHAAAVEAAALAALRRQFEDDEQLPDLSFDFSKLLDAVGTKSDDLPRSVLQIAPHLAQTDTPCSDPIIEQNWEIFSALSSEKLVDKVVRNLTRMQFSSEDPLSTALLWKIVQDQFVDFEQVHGDFYKKAASYDPSDVSIGEGEYTIIKKNQPKDRRPITSESQWVRCFDAWKVAVLYVYPHWDKELASYRTFIVDLFHSLPSEASAAIEIDNCVRTKYSLCKFRLDDENRFNRISLSVLWAKDRYNGSDASGSSSFRSSRSEKRSDVICNNWNLDHCRDPCPGGRKHGTCSECNDGHPAISSPSCKSSFEARKRKGRTPGVGIGKRGAGRA